MNFKNFIVSLEINEELKILQSMNLNDKDICGFLELYVLDFVKDYRMDFVSN